MAIDAKRVTGGESVSGLDALLKKFTVLENKSSKKVLAAMVRAKLGVIAKQMKKDTSSKVKAARKGVRMRFKISKADKMTAMVGFGVGKRNKKKVALKNSRGKKKGGVGIGPENIHWWVIGTAKRTTGAKKGKLNNGKVANRGRMPAMQPNLAAQAAAKSKGQQNKLMIERGALALEKELTKLKLKGK
jgi:hypothetical protein